MPAYETINKNQFSNPIGYTMSRYFFGLYFLFILSGTGLTQNFTQRPVKDFNSSPPYKVLTAGKKITVQSKLNITSIIAWTSSGNRIVEQKNVNLTRYSFTVPSNDRIIFLMLHLQDGKRYTQKIGLP
jgi:hypothetical protein